MAQEIASFQQRHLETRTAAKKQREQQSSEKNKRIQDTDKPVRRATVPSLEDPAKGNLHRQFLSDYSLGETIRSPFHMIVESNEELAIEAVGSLTTHDFAFVKRLDGTYSYAILAERSTEPVDGSKNKPCDAECVMEECMTFVTSKVGSTKMVRRRHWGEVMHLAFMSPEERCHAKRCSALSRETKSDDDWVPMRDVEFVPDAFDEECSVISSVSDRAW